MTPEELAKSDAAVATVADIRVNAGQLRSWVKRLRFPSHEQFEEELLFAAALLERYADNEIRLLSKANAV